jgi:hypothetical protein
LDLPAISPIVRTRVSTEEIQFELVSIVRRSLEVFGGSLAVRSDDVEQTWLSFSINLSGRPTCTGGGLDSNSRPKRAVLDEDVCREKVLNLQKDAARPVVELRIRPLSPLKLLRPRRTCWRSGARSRLDPRLPLRPCSGLAF